MKLFSSTFLLLLFLASFTSSSQSDNVEFSCMKTHKATNTCYFNFKIDGAKYRYTDMGCRYSKKTEDIIKKAKEGEIALSKDWKIACPEAKPEAN